MPRYTKEYWLPRSQGWLELSGWCKTSSFLAYLVLDARQNCSISSFSARSANLISPLIRKVPSSLIERFSIWVLSAYLLLMVTKFCLVPTSCWGRNTTSPRPPSRWKATRRWWMNVTSARSQEGVEFWGNCCQSSSDARRLENKALSILAICFNYVSQRANGNPSTVFLLHRFGTPNFS